MINKERIEEIPLARLVIPEYFKQERPTDAGLDQFLLGCIDFPVS